MNIVAVSDLHGKLPDLPKADLVLIGGDICPLGNHSPNQQCYWLNTDFRRWLLRINAKMTVGVAGNHDFVFQEWPWAKLDLPWTYLQDSGTEFEGLKIWGSPWQPRFHDWAFNLDEPQLAMQWKLIPDDTDILVLHGPPHGYGDQAPRQNGQGFENVGSPSLLKRIQEIQPKLVVFGHIHEGRGRWQMGPTTLANVSILNGYYSHVHEPMQFEFRS